MNLESIIESGLCPDFLVRIGIRRLLAERLRDEASTSAEAAEEKIRAFIAEMKAGPIALSVDAANTQHYEVPAEFFEIALGARLKYSGAYFGPGTETLDQAEERMLEIYAERAGLSDGQEVLELGCGWGSFSLWIAERFPRSRVLGVSNSRVQREFIEKRAAAKGLKNIEVLTTDMNVFATPRTFDRVVSIEMFEHMRNWEALLAKVDGFLRPGGRLFIHIFTHRTFAYAFADQDASDWMAREFFTGGMMPSDSLLFRFQKHLELTDHWVVGGEHYAKTAEAWLERMDRARDRVLAIFAATYGAEKAKAHFHKWRVFFMACAELWNYRRGREWLVSHYLFRKRPVTA